ncbi:MAG: hypothetical protein KC535_05210 [Nanoarchaeota archaeon]|nr:hypothetical protein [Nanoarchaeota archaeon]
MNIHIYSKKSDDLTDEDISFMNAQRKKFWGKGSAIDFKKEDKRGEFLFIEENKKIVAFGMMKPIKITLEKKTYTIRGIGRGFAVVKKKGWGSLLNQIRIRELKKNGKTGIAFTSRENSEFFTKAGYQVKKNGIRLFRYKDKKTGELIKDDEGDMIYFEGKDAFVTKLLSSKDPAISDTDFW